MFWLPYGWFPYYAEWLISFPRAPLGSVSIVSWQLACGAVIALVSDTVGAFITLVRDASANASRQKEQPVKAKSPEKTDTAPQAEKEGKKESS